MPAQTPNSPFPETQQDAARLKQTAIDAAADLGSTATVHAAKAKSQLKELAGHVQEEGCEQLGQVKNQLNNWVGIGREFVSSNPISCIATALTVGFLLGLSRTRARD